tara:strand:+ start:57068 stop:57367 length:300 start_codon:yes stop_codon:yes gene_type:complete
MNIIVPQFALISSVFIFILLIAFTFHFIQMQVLKKEATQKFFHLNEEIKREKEMSKKNQKACLEIVNIENTLQHKLLRMKLEVLNIDFTLKEICNFIKI